MKTFSARGVRQKFMERVVRTIFPDEIIERNKRDLNLVSENGYQLEIDCYLPVSLISLQDIFINYCLAT